MKYLRKEPFSIPIRNDLYENINWKDDEFCTCEPPKDIEPFPTPVCYCKKCGKVINEEDLP